MRSLILIASVLLIASLNTVEANIRCMNCTFNDVNCYGEVLKDCKQCVKIQVRNIPTTTTTAPPASTDPPALSKNTPMPIPAMRVKTQDDQDSTAQPSSVLSLFETNIQSLWYKQNTTYTTTKMCLNTDYNANSCYTVTTDEQETITCYCNDANDCNSSLQGKVAALFSLTLGLAAITML